jgi:hypothetical protein
MRPSREIQHNQLDSARHVTEKRFAPARNVDCHTERAVMSDADGAFPMADLEPGRYEVGNEAGFRTTSAQVQVAALGRPMVELLRRKEIMTWTCPHF